MYTTNKKHVPDTYMVEKAQTYHLTPRGGRALQVSLITHIFYNNFPISYSLKKGSSQDKTVCKILCKTPSTL